VGNVKNDGGDLMKIGAVFPTCEIGNDPAVVRDFAQTAEDLGYTHIIAYDHVLGAEHSGRDPALNGPYTEADPFHEPFTLFAYLAAVTTKIEFMTGVLILPQRQTALVAKQAAEIDVLSGGRLKLGLGTGWNYVEYDSLGASFAERGKVFDEQVTVLKKLLSDPVISFRGDYHAIERAGVLPQPTRRIPLWFGGFSPPALKRAAREGDGFLFGASNDFMRQMCGQLNQSLEENGRSQSNFGIDALIGYGIGQDAWGAEIKAWKALGAQNVSMRAMSTGAQFTGDVDPGFTKPQQHIDALETFMAVARG
jgi:probable F420-dependent oxidoreductase